MTDDARPDPAAASPDESGTGGPGAIVADTKDWTWVLDRPCPECGFVAAGVEPADVAASVRALTPRWRAALARPDVRIRPTPGTWSTLEYGAHVRDVHRLFAERLRLVLEQDDPVFANWDQDATAVQERYWTLDPAVVADELARAAEAFADAVGGVPVGALDRPARRSNGSAFTVRTLIRYYLHDVVHHTHDVGA